MNQQAISLRPLVYADWPRIHEWAQHEEACRYQPWGPNTPEQSEAFVRTAVKSWDEDPQRRYVWVAVKENSALGKNTVVGLGEFHVKNAKQRQGEIAYAVHHQLWGQGIGKQIARLLIQFGFDTLDMHRIAATCDPRNLGSASVLRKVGMIHEGRLRETIQVRDGWRDSEIFSVLRHEWTAHVL